MACAAVDCSTALALSAIVCLISVLALVVYLVDSCNYHNNLGFLEQYSRTHPKTSKR